MSFAVMTREWGQRNPNAGGFGNEFQRTPIPCSSTRTFTIAAPTAVLPQG
jgi:hypothetical protein